MTAKVIPLRRRPGDDLPDVVLSGLEAHAIAALLRKFRPHADSPRAIDGAIQLLTSPTREPA